MLITEVIAQVTNFDLELNPAKIRSFSQLQLAYWNGMENKIHKKGKRAGNPIKPSVEA